MLTDTQGKKRNGYVADYCLFDLETTGISTKFDEVIEISALKVRGGEVVEEFSTLVNPGRKIPKAATNVNGITDEMVADAPSFDQVLADFIEFIGELPLVGHNIATFDMKFLYRDCEKYFGKIPGNDYIDTLRFARIVLPTLSHHKLVDLATYYEISTVGAHRALNDCHMNQVVFERLGKDARNRKEDEKDQGLICPICGDLLQKRKGRFGLFYGCSGYPQCRYTRNASE